ncbi:MAG: twin-arginine translocase subunit TatC [Nitrospirales bacterium]|nr:twin-arginine translocase subunit TatC [Nitrospira sp.]MDR4502959.1 twin-arginine translocase subunit TatC [Nitrospirales bacterium]
MPTVAHPLSRHISELKRRLIIVGATVLVGFMIAFSYSSVLIDWFKRPFEDTLIFYSPAEALFASIKISFLAGIVASVPVILYQFWKFIEPALLKKEQGWAIPLFVLGLTCFVLGLVFCNLVILPLVIDFFVTFGMDRSISPELAVGTYVDFNVKFLLAFGFAFEIPLVLTLLARVGFIAPAMLSQYRKHAVMVALILSAVVTPDATLFTMLLMAIPLIILYEIGIIGAKVFWQPRASAETSDEPEGQDSFVSEGTSERGRNG